MYTTFRYSDDGSYEIFPLQSKKRDALWLHNSAIYDESTDSAAQIITLDENGEIIANGGDRWKLEKGVPANLHDRVQPLSRFKGEIIKGHC